MDFSLFSSLTPRLRQGLLIGLLCGLFLLFVRSFNRWEPLDRAVMDTMFQVRGERYLSSDIVVVAADDADVEREGGWPFPRSVYARLIEKFQKAGVKTIVFDVMFLRESPSPSDDQAFIRACDAADNIVHASVFRIQPEVSPIPFVPERQGNDFPAGAPYERLPVRFSFPDAPINCRISPRGAAALPELLESAAAVGHVSVAPEWDGALRRVPHLIRYGQPSPTRGIGGEHVGLYPSLSLSAALQYWNVPWNKVEIAKAGLSGGSEIRFVAPDGKKRRIPLNHNGEAMINWVGKNRMFNPITFGTVLYNSALSEDSLRGKVVIVGISAAGAFEKSSTPFSPNLEAVLFQANALDNILENRVLSEAPTWLQILLLLLMPLIAGAIVAGHNAKVNAFMLGLMCFATYTLSAMLLTWADLYVPVGAPLFGVALACGAAISYRQLTDAHYLRLAEERYVLAVRGANDGLWDWNLVNNVIYYSPRWKEMMGCADEEVSNSPDEWFRRVHPEDIGVLRDELKRHIAGETDHFEHEYRMLHKSGTYREILTRGLRVKNDEGRATRMAGSHSDITNRKRAERQLHHNAFYDGLTGLPNRALFVSRLEQAVARAQRRADYKFAVLFLDVDRFKNVNDSLGHAAGDQLIKELAKRIAVCLRLGDTPARLGGDEFTILLDDIEDVNDATRVAERFQQELSQTVSIDSQELNPSISVGIALSTTGYDDPQDVLRDADIAVARAKALGAGRREVFDTRMHERAVALLRIETDLRRALEKQAFQVYYQPLVDLKSGRLCGFEALARWPHPARGMVSPGEFIPIAEDTGLIIPMDQWVMQESCRQFNQWEKQAGRELSLFMSVNLSSKQFSQNDLVEQIEQAVREAHFSPERMKIEVTESAIMDNTDSAAAMLLRLREIGFQLAIDDFGTGYSSLSYLHRFPMDTLKIDRSFVKAMSDRGEVEIVRTIITLAKNFGMTVVAEGVETEEQLQMLRDLDCHIGQGYFFSRPLTGEAAYKIIEENPQW